MPSTEGQLQVRISLAILHLASCRRFSESPHNALARGIGRFNCHRSSSEPIAKDIRHIIPYSVLVKIVREDSLADIRLEKSALDRGNLESDTAGCRVTAESLTRRRVLGDYNLGADTRPNGPEIDGFVALIGNNGATYGVSASDEGGENDCIEEHYERR